MLHLHRCFIVSVEKAGFWKLNVHRIPSDFPKKSELTRQLHPSNHCFNKWTLAGPRRLPDAISALGSLIGLFTRSKTCGLISWPLPWSVNFHEWNIRFSETKGLCHFYGGGVFDSIGSRWLELFLPRQRKDATADCVTAKRCLIA